MTLKTVSTVIPCFNHGSVLARAVESVFAQSGALTVDVIVVDDGSTDITPDVCGRLLQKFPRLRVVRKTNGGLASARNAGISLAVGDFFHFLDADDYIEPSAYSELIGGLEQHASADVAYCGYEVVDPSGKVRSRTTGEHVAGDMRARLLIGCLGPPHSFFVRRRAIEAGGIFDANLNPCEDWDYWLRLSLSGHQFVHVPGALVYYELGTTNMSRNYLRMVEGAERVLRNAERYTANGPLEKFRRDGLRRIRQCMFDISYADGMRRDLESGRFLTAARDLRILLHKDPKSMFPAIHSLMRHKRAIARGMAALWSRTFV